MGLTISKKLVELMGGSIGVDSKKGEGSRFYFTALFGIGSEKESNNSVPDSLQDLCFLVVDDNHITREIIAGYLKQLRFEVQKVDSGIKAIELLKAGQQRFDIIMMDWQMPDKDGISVTRTIRQDAGIATQPKIIITSAFDRDTLPKLIEKEDIDGYLTKPVTPSSLFDSVMQVYGNTSNKLQLKQSKKNSLKSGTLGAKLLVVEDNEINQQVAKEMLENNGIEVSVASNGKEAIDILKNKSEDFDGVLMDIQMPIMDGLATTKIIRQDDRFSELPIIAMTANAMTQDVQLCLETGMNDHISKPIDVEDLFAKINRWIIAKNPSKKTTGDSEKRSGKKHLSKEDFSGIPNLNVSRALKRFGGQIEVFSKILQQFANSRQSMGSDLLAAVKKEDYKSAEFIAHTLRGVTGNIGADSLASELEALESQIKQSQPDMQGVLAIKDALDSLVTHIRSVLDQETSGEGKGGFVKDDPILLLCEIDNIIISLEDEEQDVLVQLQHLRDEVIDESTKDWIKSICGEVSNHKYNRALTLTNELKLKLQEECG